MKALPNAECRLAVSVSFISETLEEASLIKFDYPNLQMGIWQSPIANRQLLVRVPIRRDHDISNPLTRHNRVHRRQLSKPPQRRQQRP